jgi:hypothetical protein
MGNNRFANREDNGESEEAKWKCEKSRMIFSDNVTFQHWQQ